MVFVLSEKMTMQDGSVQTDNGYNCQPWRVAFCKVLKLKFYFILLCEFLAKVVQHRITVFAARRAHVNQLPYPLPHEAKAFQSCVGSVSHTTLLLTVFACSTACSCLGLLG